MHAVKSFLPNRFYVSDSGTLVYLLEVEPNQDDQVAVGVLVGPLLASPRYPDWFTYSIGHKILSNIKFIIMRTNEAASWYEIELPISPSRIYNVLQAVVGSFVSFSKNINVFTVSLPKSVNNLFELGYTDQIQELIKGKGILLESLPWDRSCDRPVSFAFDNQKDMEEFRGWAKKNGLDS